VTEATKVSEMDNSDRDAARGDDGGDAPVGTVTGPKPIPPRRRRRRRGRTVKVTVVILVIAAGTSAAYVERAHWPHDKTVSANSVADNAAAVSTSTVTRQNLTAQTAVSGTLGYEGSYTVTANAPGIVTALPGVGQVIGQGKPLYEVDGAGIDLLYGNIPAYRDMSEDDTGSDVKELNTDLVALGYATSAQISAGSDHYSWRTQAAVEKLQAAMGVKQDGTLHLGQVVFLPGALRVTTVPAVLGATAAGTVLTGTSTTRQVTVQLDATEQAQVKAGDQVVITLPDNSTTPGTVSTIGTVATAGSGSDSSPTIEITITPDDPAATGSLDQAPVQVSITTGSVANALVVPVTALLALAGGGYAVEAVLAGGAHVLVPVSLGLFDDADGLVQVTGTGLRAGEAVVVAGQ
jgi:peptidoglycan hydrolase-like protein with peptidoglycan-binding domain